jgi:hypothetical protein
MVILTVAFAVSTSSGKPSSRNITPLPCSQIGILLSLEKAQVEKLGPIPSNNPLTLSENRLLPDPQVNRSK